MRSDSTQVGAALSAPLLAGGISPAAPPQFNPVSELLANRAFAFSALIAAMMRVATAPADQWWMPAIAGTAVINGLIGWLFLIRRPVLALGTPWQLASCLPTMLGFALAVRLAPPLSGWPWYAHCLFAAGTLVTVAAFLRLGGSFGVLPALRQVVARGPYAVVRHPAYAGELVMALACFSAGPSLAGAFAWLLLVPGVVWRIRAEEAVLRSDRGYHDYSQQVRWRLVPGLW